ncbi:hypothetical protein BDW22DRAFT_1487122 [Trametopsis cervina]|nr:hypothetical protein BDW22DRAFT_1487122 [Trametopsis cervina]
MDFRLTGVYPRGRQTDWVEQHSGVVQAAAAQLPSQALTSNAHASSPIVRRRRRDSNDGDRNFLDKLNRKPLKTFVAQARLEKDLLTDSFEFTELSHAEMVIDTKAHLVAIEVQMDAREVPGHSFLFSGCRGHRLGINLTTDRMKDDPEAYEISRRMFCSPEEAQTVRSTISYVLKQIRSTMRVRVRTV